MHRLFRDQLSHKTCLSIWFWLKSSFTNQWLEANTLQKDYLWPEISNTTLTQSHLESLRHIDFQCVSSLTVPLMVNWEDLVFGYCILISFFWTEFNCIMTDLILIGIKEYLNLFVYQLLTGLFFVFQPLHWQHYVNFVY